MGRAGGAQQAPASRGSSARAPGAGHGAAAASAPPGIPQDGLLLDSLIPPHAEQGWARGGCTWC